MILTLKYCKVEKRKEHNLTYWWPGHVQHPHHQSTGSIWVCDFLSERFYQSKIFKAHPILFNVVILELWNMLRSSKSFQRLDEPYWTKFGFISCNFCPHPRMNPHQCVSIADPYQPQHLAKLHMSQRRNTCFRKQSNCFATNIFFHRACCHTIEEKFTLKLKRKEKSMKIQNWNLFRRQSIGRSICTL